MTWAARSRSGTGSPRSLQLAWMLAIMAPAESISVPSQSNTSNSNRFGIYFLFQDRYEIFQFRRQRRLQLQPVAGQRMHEGELPRVQEHALHALLGQALVQFEIAVLVVAHDGEPQMGEMHADLVGAPGFELRLQQTVGAADALEFEHRVRLAPFIVDADAALARTGDIALQLQFHVLFARGPLALHQYQVALVHLPSPDQFMHCREYRAFLGQQQQPRSVAVEPMHQFEELRLGARRAQLLDHAMADAAAAVHRQAGGFVGGDQAFVLVEQRQVDNFRRLGWGCLLAQPQGRDAHPVAVLQLVGRIHTPAVDPDLPAPENAVDMALGHAFALAQQEIVYALVRGFGANIHLSYGNFT